VTDVVIERRRVILGWSAAYFPYALMHMQGCEGGGQFEDGIVAVRMSDRGFCGPDAETGAQKVRAHLAADVACNDAVALLRYNHLPRRASGCFPKQAPAGSHHDDHPAQ
jgi:hypothetical protein